MKRRIKQLIERGVIWLRIKGRKPDPIQVWLRGEKYRQSHCENCGGPLEWGGMCLTDIDMEYWSRCCNMCNEARLRHWRRFRGAA